MWSSPIFIIGLPACGKSTFGRALAHCLGREFIDLDKYIENRFHTSVRELFAQRGESCFRALESAMLREVGEFENVVIATGGGAPCHSQNMEYMSARGVTLWIQASIAKLRERVLLNPHKRPLLAGLSPEQVEARLLALQQLRAPFYNRAKIHFATDDLENRRQIDAAVSAFMAQYGPGLQTP